MTSPATSRALRPILALAAALTFMAAATVAQAAGPTAASDLGTIKSARTYTPQAGESLDSVIRKTMVDSPLKIELLRQAYLNLNPQAFVAGNVGRLRIGVALRVPDHDQLMQATLAPQAKDTNASPSRSGPQSGANERRDWVRYP